jgi:hypothetical protein
MTTRSTCVLAACAGSIALLGACSESADRVVAPAARPSGANLEAAREENAPDINVEGTRYSSDAWTPQMICGALVQAYFYLQAPPSLTEAVDEVFLYRSAAGHLYRCQLRNEGRTQFDWVVDGRPRRGEGARWSFNEDDELVVELDVGERRYRASDGLWFRSDR